MFQQWDFLMEKKLLINYQVIIKLLKNNKENCYFNDIIDKYMRNLYIFFYCYM